MVIRLEPIGFCRNVIKERQVCGIAFISLDTDPLSPGLHNFSTGYNNLTYMIFGTGPSLVICQVPGWGIGPSYLSNGLAPLHDSFEILYFTPRGTPPSSRPLDTLEMSSKHMVDDLEILRQYLKLGSMLLLGHSNGGSIAFGYAQQYPSHVDKLVCLTTSCKGSTIRLHISSLR